MHKILFIPVKKDFLYRFWNRYKYIQKVSTFYKLVYKVTLFTSVKATTDVKSFNFYRLTSFASMTVDDERTRQRQTSSSPKPLLVPSNNIASIHRLIRDLDRDHENAAPPCVSPTFHH